jgi:hypothetical protein
VELSQYSETNTNSLRRELPVPCGFVGKNVTLTLIPGKKFLIVKFVIYLSLELKVRNLCLLIATNSFSLKVEIFETPMYVCMYVCSVST